ncbi:MAG: glycosyltransferase [candidate division KSB1 bacterium]|nr:glycosyltransferase [candidate division KSB1 bacterium]
MRILLLVKRFDFGGAENHVCDLANGLAQAGHHVWVAGQRGRQMSRLDSVAQFVDLPLSDWTLLWRLFFLCRFLRTQKIDLIHAHQRLAIRLAGLAGLLTGIPVVATVHGRTRHDLGNWFFRRLPQRVIFVSKQVLKRATRFSCLAEKSVYIPNGLNSNRQGTFCKDRILYISRIDRRHGKLLSIIIRDVMPALLTDHPQLTFEIFGDGKGLPFLKKTAEELNRRLGRLFVRLHGFQPEPQMILEGSLVMGVGRAAMKGLASGLPVLSINRKHLGPVITCANYPVLKDSNFVDVTGGKPTPRTLLLRLREALSKLEELAEERILLQQSVLQDFDSATVIRRTEQLYQEVLVTACGAVTLGRCRAADVPSMRRA